MVEGTGLENRHTGNGIESSNLSLSVLYPSELGTEAEVSAPRQVVRSSQLRYVWGRVAEWFKAHAWKVCVR